MCVSRGVCVTWRMCNVVCAQKNNIRPKWGERKAFSGEAKYSTSNFTLVPPNACKSCKIQHQHRYWTWLTGSCQIFGDIKFMLWDCKKAERARGLYVAPMHAGTLREFFWQLSLFSMSMTVDFGRSMWLAEEPKVIGEVIAALTQKICLLWNQFLQIPRQLSYVTLCTF